MSWSEGIIAGEIARQTLERKCVVLVDNCNWTGHECDVLGVTTDLRIIDVEVKISRSDLKADAKKDKWWHRKFAGYGPVEPTSHGRYRPALYDSTQLQWPPKVWKHYYALPAEIWDDKLFDFLPSPMSGVLLLSQKPGELVQVRCHRRSTPNKDAVRLGLDQVMNIARLANLRMWESYRAVDRAQQDAEYWRQQAKVAA